MTLLATFDRPSELDAAAGKRGELSVAAEAIATQSRTERPEFYRFIDSSISSCAGVLCRKSTIEWSEIILTNWRSSNSR